MAYTATTTGEWESVMVNRNGRRVVVAAVWPGQRVVTSHGRVAVVAMVRGDGVAMAYDGRGGIEPVRVVSDAWGGEHDQTLGHRAA